MPKEAAAKGTSYKGGGRKGEKKVEKPNCVRQENEGAQEQRRERLKTQIPSYELVTKAWTRRKSVDFNPTCLFEKRKKLKSQEQFGGYVLCWCEEKGITSEGGTIKKRKIWKIHSKPQAMEISMLK